MGTKKNAWFKHYNTATDGATLRSLWDAGDFEAYGMFWRLLELVSRWEDSERRGSVTLSWSVVARETGWKPSKCRRVLARIVSVSKIEMNEKPGGNVSFLVPNWLELQETRGGKRASKNKQKPDRGKRKEERGEIDSNLHTKSCDLLMTSWNEVCTSRPQALVQNKKRIHAADWFLKTHSHSDWVTACGKVEASDFLSGRSGKWTSCNVDWLLKLENFTKVIEGNYDNAQPEAFSGYQELPTL